MPTALSADRSRVCTYTFENSSKCRLPLSPKHRYLCTFHARKDAEERAEDDASRDIAFPLSRRYVSYCDLTSAIANTITAVAYNYIPTRSAATIAYLTQNLVQSLAGAEREYKEAFGTPAWRQMIADNFNDPRPAESSEEDSSEYSHDLSEEPSDEAHEGQPAPAVSPTPDPAPLN
jgi:hypothetical protein